jgi:hypothetical protein
MRKFIVSLTLASFMVALNQSPALAIKEFGDAWTEFYAKSSDNDDFKKLVAEAKCNVCHIQGENKKKHNPYGEEVEELLKKADFPKERFKKEPEKCKEEIEAAFKKVEEIKAKDGETFGEKIKAGKLPGGDKDGK